MRQKSFLLAAIWCGLAAPAVAQVEVLSEQNGWSVLRSFNPENGVTWCSMQTWNELGMKFAFNGSDTRHASLLFLHDDFDFDERQLPMTVSIDDAVWSFDMLLQGSSMLANLRDNPQSDDLMDALSLGRTLSVQHANGGPDFSWSLAGIDAPFRQVLECWAEAVEARPE